MSQPDASPEPPRGIAVFGSSTAAPGDPDWQNAMAVGHGVASRGLPVITGGYGGVMEAASHGARMGGGETVGVTCALWRGRRPNPYLSLEIEEPDLFTRTARLFALSRGFVVLGGGAGTLAELALLWAHARAGVLAGPFVVLDDGWAGLLRDLARDGRLEPQVVRATYVARDPDDAVQLACSAGER